MASTCVYVYGFAPGTTEEEFCAEFFADFDQSEIVQRIDFKGEKIFAFVHVNTEEQANDLIENWNGQQMKNSKFGLQVRIRGQNNHIKPREPNLFVYGFSKGMTKEDFQQEFFLKFPEVWEACIKVDFLADKLQAFVHCADTAHCDQIITHWDGRAMENSSKALQVRYKGDNGEQGRMHKMAPVLYVYGFPKGMDEESFRGEFFANHPQHEQKTDFHANKLYSFIHCHNVQQCQELRQTWDGKKMTGSVKPLQVSLRDMHQPKNGQKGMMMNGMGMNQYGNPMMNGPRHMQPQMGMMVPGQYAPMMVPPQMQQGYGMPMGMGYGMQQQQMMQQQMMQQNMMMNGGNNKRQMSNNQNGQMNGQMNGGQMNGGYNTQNNNQGLMQMNNRGNAMNGMQNGAGPQNKRIKMQNGNMQNNMMQNNMKMGYNNRGPNPNQFNQGDGNYMGDQNPGQW